MLQSITEQLDFCDRHPLRRLALAVALMLPLVLLLPPAPASSATSGPSSDAVVTPNTTEPRNGVEPRSFMRVTVHVLGVFSLSGFFNMQARLYQTQGLARYKFNLRDSLMILDFEPGVSVPPSEIKQLMVEAGYRPGPFSIQQLPVSALSDSGSGWIEAPRVSGQSSLVRWLKMNF